MKQDETLTDIARSCNIKAYGVKKDAALPEDSGTEVTVVAGSLTIPAEATPRTSGEEFFRTEGAYTGLDEPIPGGQIARWLLVEGPHIDSGVELFDELCWRLLGDDVPLWRATYHVGVLHPQIRGIGLRWLRDRKVVEDYRILHGSEETDEYRLSPIRATIERGTPFRRRLDRPVPEYPLLERIRKAGGTDYFALALNRTFRRFPTVTWATDRPDGFSDADIAKLEDINPALAAIAETRAERRIGTSLLDTWAAHPRRADSAGPGRAHACGHHDDRYA